MAYQKLPNHGTLFKAEKTSDDQPNYKGYLLLDRVMIENLLKASNGDIEIDVSLWRKETKNGAINLNLQCSAKGMGNPPAKPPTSEEIKRLENYIKHEATAEEKSELKRMLSKAPADPQAYLNKLKGKIAAINNPKDFEELYNKIHSPEVWAVFKQNVAIAQEASTILSVKKGELVFTPPVDLSAIISALDVECDRLKLGKKEHCLIRWNKPRAMLSTEELEIYLEELRSAKPMPPDSDFF